MEIFEPAAWSGYEERGHSFRLRCPVCGHEYTHHGDVVVFERVYGEDSATVVLRPGYDIAFPLQESSPSPRRHAVRISFAGECGHRWYMDIIQHKGETYIVLKVLPGVPNQEV